MTKLINNKFNKADPIINAWTANVSDILALIKTISFGVIKLCKILYCELLAKTLLFLVETVFH